MTKFLFGLLSGIVVLVGVAVCVMWMGVVNVSARQRPDPVDTLLGWAARRSISHHAGVGVESLPARKEAVSEGLEHYARMCTMCHGAPGVEGVDFLEQGLNPKPPAMDSARIQNFSDSELLRILENGVRATGMPAFGAVEDEAALRNIDAAVRAMPDLSADMLEVIRANTPALGHSQHGEEEPDRHKHGSADGERERGEPAGGEQESDTAAQESDSGCEHAGHSHDSSSHDG